MSRPSRAAACILPQSLGRYGNQQSHVACTHSCSNSGRETTSGACCIPCHRVLIFPDAKHMCSEGSSLPSSLKIPGTLAIDSRRMRYKGATKCQKRTAWTGQSCRKATFSLSYCIDVAYCHLSCWWHTMLPQCCEAHKCNSPESAGMRRGIHMRYVVARSSQTSNLITHRLAATRPRYIVTA